MEDLSATSALVGVVAGWGLKSVADFLSWALKERRQFRRATFDLLRTYFVLAEYDRTTTYFQSRKPSIDVFEATRSTIEASTLERLDPLKSSLTEALSLLGSISPTKALELDRALVRLPRVMNGLLQRTALQRPASYADLLHHSDEIVATTLIALQKATRSAALRAGVWPWLKVRLWFIRHHGKGQRNFEAGMERQHGMREKTNGLGSQAYADAFWSSFGQDVTEPPEQQSRGAVSTPAISTTAPK